MKKHLVFAIIYCLLILASLMGAVALSAEKLHILAFLFTQGFSEAILMLLPALLGIAIHLLLLIKPVGRNSAFMTFSTINILLYGFLIATPFINGPGPCYGCGFFLMFVNIPFAVITTIVGAFALGKSIAPTNS